MADKKLNLIIDAKLEGKQQIDNTTKSIKKMEAQAESSVSKMEKSFRRLGGAVQAAAGSMIIKAGAEAIKKAEKMSVSFDILKIKNAEVAEALERTGEITSGLASKYDLVTSANKALSFGIDLSNGRFEKLLGLANKTALVMGTDVKSAFDDLITGVARESKMILDNLGVQVNLNEVYSAYAAEIGVATESLTKQQRQTALLDEANRQLEKSTAAVTDEMVKQSTKGTAAIKKVENAWNLFLNTSAKGFVRLGEIIGQTAAANPFADVQRQYVEWQSYLKKAQTITSDAEVMSFEEYRKWRKARSKLDKEELTLKAKMQEDYLKWEKDARERVYDEGDVAAMLPSERFAAQQDASFKSFWENRSKKRATIRRKAIKSGTKKSGGDLLGESLGLPADTAAAAEELKHKLITLANSIDTDLNELKRRNALQRLAIAKKTADEEVAIEKEKADKIRKEQERNYKMLKRFGSEYLNAIVTGQAEMIPQILANQAMMFGQELFWDGLKTFWMGKAKDALFPGLGTSASAVGIAEMGIGAGLMAVGGVANYAMNGGGASTGGAQSQESNQASNQEMNINVETSLYGSKKEAQRALSGMGVNIRG